MKCTCATPRPTIATEDRYEQICGVLVWCGGVEYTACATCGYPLTLPVPTTAEPLEEAPTP